MPKIRQDIYTSKRPH